MFSGARDSLQATLLRLKDNLGLWKLLRNYIIISDGKEIPLGEIVGFEGEECWVKIVK